MSLNFLCRGFVEDQLHKILAYQMTKVVVNDSIKLTFVYVKWEEFSWY